MDHQKPNQESRYSIRIEGVLNHSIPGWLDSITIIPRENGETELTGSFTDQAALRGFVNQLWNLNFTVLTIERIEKDPDEKLI
jgi:hypothetical protein